MFGLFGPRLPIDADELDFQLATLKWLQGQFGERRDAPLVLPTGAFFPPADARGEEGVRYLFDCVRRIAGMEDWPCALQAGAADRPVDLGGAALLRHEGPSAPCGTFRIVEGLAGRHALITYNPGMMRDRPALVATFAHELAHYLLATAAAAPPGGWELHELHTDLAAVWMGFGIFLANSARNFAQFQDGAMSGWQSRTQGYLGEGALVTALALVERLRGRDPMIAAPHLKDYLAADLRKAARGLARALPDTAAAVEAADLAAYGA